MFWPFHKWRSAPAPWGGSDWNTPVELRDASFMASRAHAYPKYAARFIRFFSLPTPARFVSPTRPVGAFSKHPGDAMQVMADADAHLNGLAMSAFAKYAAGVPMTLAEGQALMQVHLPPVATPRERYGAGASAPPDWDVPFSDRTTVPQPIMQREAQFLHTAEQQRKLAVGAEIARIESIRSQMMARAGRGGR